MRIGRHGGASIGRQPTHPLVLCFLILAAFAGVRQALRWGCTIRQKDTIMFKKYLLFLPALLVFRLGVDAAAKPNIVYIMLDEWGYYEMSGLGHPRLETPHIDRFADEGLRFTQFLAGASLCAPTRATLMLGQHTGHTTVRANSGTAPIRDADTTVAEILKQAGYATGGFGKWGLGDRGSSGVPERQGFDEFFGYYHQVHAHTYFPNYLVRNGEKVPLPGNTGHAFKGETFSQYLIHDAALEFIRAQDGKKPFFAYLPYTLPHAYYGVPEDDPAYVKYKDKAWDAPPHHHNPAVAPPDEAQRYAAFIAMADRQVGEVLSTLKELGIAENTIVFVSGDNGANARVFTNDTYPHGFFAPNTNPRTGETFRGHKGNFYEGGLRVPYIVRWPGKVQPGTVSDHLGYFPDVLPTLAELAGADIPDDVDGISFLPTLLGKTAEQQQHDYLYWELGSHIAVRQGSWKAVKPAKSASFELYDLSEDLGETTNIADRHPDVVARLKQMAAQAHQPRQQGETYNRSLGFQGHQAK